MHFIDGHRRVQPVPAGAARQPLGIVPRLRRRCFDARRRGGTKLEGTAERIGLHQHRAAGAVAYLELVQSAGTKLRYEQFPDARAAESGHLVHAPVPAVEVSDHGHALGIRRPDAEAGAGRALPHFRPGTEQPISLVVAPLAKQMQIEGGGLGRESVGVAAECAVNQQAEGLRRGLAAAPLENAGGVDAGKAFRAMRHFQCDRGSMWPEDTESPPLPFPSQAEAGERIMFARGKQPVPGFRGGGASDDGSVSVSSHIRT